MKGEPSKKWEGLIETFQSKTFENFKNKVIELVEEIMGKDVNKDQINLVNIPQPTNLLTAVRCNRVVAFSTGLIYLKPQGRRRMKGDD